MNHEAKPINEPAHILIVDDLPDNAALLKKMLRAEGHETTIMDRGTTALDRLSSHEYDLILLDVMLPDLDGFEVCRRLKAHPTLRYVPIILVTARVDMASIVQGLDAGADDYLTKPVDRRELLARTRSALRSRRLQQALLAAHRSLKEQSEALRRSHEELLARIRENEALNAELQAVHSRLNEVTSMGDMVGQSPAMRRVFERIALVAPHDATVLIRGETGTGKELVARAIHAKSPRSAGPFVAINCGAIPEGLLESELFGHQRGAFTGAERARAGRFEQAAGGTLFLDEIGDLPQAMQVKLLRVLQEKRFERLGGSEALHADFRLIAATHRDLETMVDQDAFRRDLYYRLNVVPIELPPLRERLEDIPLLADRLLERLARRHQLPRPSLEASTVAALRTRRWPGNVRELENLLERALVLGGGTHLVLEASDEAMPRHTPLEGPALPRLTLPFRSWKQALLERYERIYIVEALRRHGGNMSAAGREAGVDAKTFSRKIRAYHIQRTEYLGAR